MQNNAKQCKTMETRLRYAPPNAMTAQLWPHPIQSIFRANIPKVANLLISQRLNHH
jgi:hypothetical protein